MTVGGWKATIAWTVCASIHREYAKGRDPFYKTSQADFVKAEEDCRSKVLEEDCRSKALEEEA